MNTFHCTDPNPSIRQQANPAAAMAAAMAATSLNPFMTAGAFGHTYSAAAANQYAAAAVAAAAAQQQQQLTPNLVPKFNGHQQNSSLDGQKPETGANKLQNAPMVAQTGTSTPATSQSQSQSFVALASEPKRATNLNAFKMPSHYPTPAQVAAAAAAAAAHVAAVSAAGSPQTSNISADQLSYYMTNPAAMTVAAAAMLSSAGNSSLSSTSQPLKSSILSQFYSSSPINLANNLAHFGVLGAKSQPLPSAPRQPNRSDCKKPASNCDTPTSEQAESAAKAHDASAPSQSESQPEHLHRESAQREASEIGDTSKRSDDLDDAATTTSHSSKSTATHRSPREDSDEFPLPEPKRPHLDNDRDESRQLNIAQTQVNRQLDTNDDQNGKCANEPQDLAP